MMKANRNNRLRASWICPHCGEEVRVNRFRLSAHHPGCVICPRSDCAKAFPWKQQNRGRLWPEQAAYNVLR
ncbi:endogenous inhibitor of DNA gyrase (YacG/DUF329 family) [Edaphobacter lichenicola]|jgi:hypothetical protein|uniref:Endogenous inhibitor of DNA gyrase (YacG/DUF329 family) n=1 Tax=Tunturiibacter lichenicola TaxID=2051959 RepID=A0A7Y9NRG9_9BACT|nr:endogenous inhibitor of DNA gyrase (YacG/DUF329 family) [Edaphobacter lichenicola]